MKISPNKSPANNSTAPLSPRPVRVARVAPGSLDPWGLTNPHNGQMGGPGCRQGPRPPCGPLGVNPLSFPQFCPQHVNKTAHISVHMNVDRNTDRVFEVIWTARRCQDFSPRRRPFGWIPCRATWASLESAIPGLVGGPTLEKSAPARPPAPGGQFVEVTFLLERGVRRGQFLKMSARLRRAKIYYIYYFYRFSKNFDRDPTAERWCDVYAVTTFFQICQN